MQYVFAALGALFLRITPALVTQVLVALGVSVVTYTGVDLTLTFVKSQALSGVNGLPSEIVSLLGYMGVGKFINIIFSALVARLTLSGMSGGSLKVWSKA